MVRMAKARHAEQVAEQAAQTDTQDSSIATTPHHPRRRAVTTILEDPDDLVREQLGGFIQFLRDHAVVGVAIGFIVGLQAQTLIKQLVDSFITPLLTLIVGQDLQHRSFTIGNGPSEVGFPWGAFVYSLVDFLVVLLFIYLVVKIFRLDRLDKK
jgi:large-conductance mechanosensitive channel